MRHPKGIFIFGNLAWNADMARPGVDPHRESSLWAGPCRPYSIMCYNPRHYHQERRPIVGGWISVIWLLVLGLVPLPKGGLKRRRSRDLKGASMSYSRRLTRSSEEFAVSKAQRLTVRPVQIKDHWITNHRDCGDRGAEASRLSPEIAVPRWWAVSTDVRPHGACRRCLRDPSFNHGAATARPVRPARVPWSATFRTANCLRRSPARPVAGCASQVPYTPPGRLTLDPVTTFHHLSPSRGGLDGAEKILTGHSGQLYVPVHFTSSTCWNR